MSLEFPPHSSRCMHRCSRLKGVWSGRSNLGQYRHQVSQSEPAVMNTVNFIYDSLHHRSTQTCTHTYNMYTLTGTHTTHRFAPPTHSVHAHTHTHTHTQCIPVLYRTIVFSSPLSLLPLHASRQTRAEPWAGHCLAGTIGLFRSCLRLLWAHPTTTHSTTSFSEDPTYKIHSTTHSNP